MEIQRSWGSTGLKIRWGSATTSSMRLEQVFVHPSAMVRTAVQDQYLRSNRVEIKPSAAAGPRRSDWRLGTFADSRTAATGIAPGPGSGGSDAVSGRSHARAQRGQEMQCAVPGRPVDNRAAHSGICRLATANRAPGPKAGPGSSPRSSARTGELADSDSKTIAVEGWRRVRPEPDDRARKARHQGQPRPDGQGSGGQAGSPPDRATSSRSPGRARERRRPVRVGASSAADPPESLTRYIAASAWAIRS